MRSPIGALFFVAVILLLDSYFFQALKTVSQNSSPKTKTIIYSIYWGLTALAIISFLLFVFTDQNFLGKKIRTYLFAMVMGLFLAKLVASFFFLIDDVRRVLQWVASKLFFKNTEAEVIAGDGITRSAFLSWLGIAASGTLFGSLVYGFGNKYNYNLKKVPLAFSNLPTAFKGLKIIQISDVHSGSFTDEKAVLYGIQKILDEKPDLILFTGDLVNDRAEEMNNYKKIFSQLKAPLGVFSILGNHDYGDYVPWADRDETHLQKEKIAQQHLLTPLQQQNLEALKLVHKEMGWTLLQDEFVTIKKDDAEFALLGVQNISGKARFHSYGNMAKAYDGANKYPFKILMSHDPSHWEKEVKTKYSDIDLILSGHTHGMQFGVEIPWLKWSPVQYVYKQWAGLYEDGNQKLYVNRGFGFLGYPGRVGILPEITLITLT
jgi:uncharacterized protein